jgi:hypothetical protein
MAAQNQQGKPVNIKIDTYRYLDNKDRPIVPKPTHSDPVFRSAGIHQTASLKKTEHHRLKAEIVAGLQAEQERGSRC